MDKHREMVLTLDNPKRLMLIALLDAHMGFLADLVYDDKEANEEMGNVKVLLERLDGLSELKTVDLSEMARDVLQRA
jgi:hypothetical protein